MDSYPALDQHGTMTPTSNGPQHSAHPTTANQPPKSALDSSFHPSPGYDTMHQNQHNQQHPTPLQSNPVAAQERFGSSTSPKSHGHRLPGNKSAQNNFHLLDTSHTLSHQDHQQHHEPPQSKNRLQTALNTNIPDPAALLDQSYIVMLDHNDVYSNGDYKPDSPVLTTTAPVTPSRNAQLSPFNVAGQQADQTNDNWPHNGQIVMNFGADDEITAAHPFDHNLLADAPPRTTSGNGYSSFRNGASTVQTPRRTTTLGSCAVLSPKTSRGRHVNPPHPQGSQALSTTHRGHQTDPQQTGPGSTHPDHRAAPPALESTRRTPRTGNFDMLDDAQDEAELQKINSDVFDEKPQHPRMRAAPRGYGYQQSGGKSRAPHMQYIEQHVDPLEATNHHQEQQTQPIHSSIIATRADASTQSVGQSETDASINFDQNNLAFRSHSTHATPLTHTMSSQSAIISQVTDMTSRDDPTATPSIVPIALNNHHFSDLQPLPPSSTATTSLTPSSPGAYFAQHTGHPLPTPGLEQNSNDTRVNNNNPTPHTDESPSMQAYAQPHLPMHNAPPPGASPSRTGPFSALSPTFVLQSVPLHPNSNPVQPFSPYLNSFGGSLLSPLPQSMASQFKNVALHQNQYDPSTMPQPFQPQSASAQTELNNLGSRRESATMQASHLHNRFLPLANQTTTSTAGQMSDGGKVHPHDGLAAQFSHEMDIQPVDMDADEEDEDQPHKAPKKRKKRRSIYSLKPTKPRVNKRGNNDSYTEYTCNRKGQQLVQLGVDASMDDSSQYSHAADNHNNYSTYSDFSDYPAAVANVHHVQDRRQGGGKVGVSPYQSPKTRSRKARATAASPDTVDYSSSGQTGKVGRGGNALALGGPNSRAVDLASSDEPPTNKRRSGRLNSTAAADANIDSSAAGAGKKTSSSSRHHQGASRPRNRHYSDDSSSDDEHDQESTTDLKLAGQFASLQSSYDSTQQELKTVRVKLVRVEKELKVALDEAKLKSSQVASLTTRLQNTQADHKIAQTALSNAERELEKLYQEGYGSSSTTTSTSTAPSSSSRLRVSPKISPSKKPASKAASTKSSPLSLRSPTPSLPNSPQSSLFTTASLPSGLKVQYVKTSRGIMEVIQPPTPIAKSPKSTRRRASALLLSSPQNTSAHSSPIHSSSMLRTDQSTTATTSNHNQTMGDDDLDHDDDDDEEEEEEEPPVKKNKPIPRRNRPKRRGPAHGMNGKFISKANQAEMALVGKVYVDPGTLQQTLGTAGAATAAAATVGAVGSNVAAQATLSTTSTSTSTGPAVHLSNSTANLHRNANPVTSTSTAPTAAGMDDIFISSSLRSTRHNAHPSRGQQTTSQVDNGNSSSHDDHHRHSRRSRK